MNIRESIGKRITLSRKKLGITIKELAKRTNQLSAARINNWELGTRSPGPSEAKILAGVLGVSPSYLLCLSDSPEGDLHLQAEILPRFVPLIPISNANMDKEKLHELICKLTPRSDEIEKIPLHGKTKLNASSSTFATTIVDNSMSPEFKPGDVVIADPDKKPNPSQYVIAYLKAKKQIVLRKYRDTDTSSTSKKCYELAALHPDWGTARIEDNREGKIIATIIEHRRFF